MTLRLSKDNDEERRAKAHERALLWAARKAKGVTKDDVLLNQAYQRALSRDQT